MDIFGNPDTNRRKAGSLAGKALEYGKGLIREGALLRAGRASRPSQQAEPVEGALSRGVEIPVTQVQSSAAQSGTVRARG